MPRYASVVTRYYGGANLGKGGLGRAYAGGVSRAVEGMPRREHVDRRLLRVVCDYAARDPVLRLARDVEAELVDEAYGVDVTLVVGVPVGEVARFVVGVAGLTGGAGTVEEGE